MKGVAEFVMRGRFQALLIIMVGAGSMLFCWVSAAALALITLRKGAGEGVWLLFWALLPAGTMLYVYGDSGPLTLLVGATALALVLRSTVSLPMTTLASAVIAAVTGLGLLAFGEAFLGQMAEVFNQFLSNLEQQLAEGTEGKEAIELMRPTEAQLAGMLGAANGSMALLCVLLARYWQAALFNPGGFGVEFRALRYPVVVSIVLPLAAMALVALDAQYQTWAMICLLPLSVAGIALVHARVAHRGQGAGWLTGFYLVWLFFDPVKLFVVFFAIADSWFDFRQRWAAAGPPVERDEED
jgi:hypothetical protein